MQNFKNDILQSVKIIFFAIILSLGISAISLYKTNTTEAKIDPPTINFSGYIWADNIGWISLAGSNYKVSMGDNGNFFGYGWSDNIGWVSFNQADVSVGCPTAPAVLCSSPNLNRYFGLGQGKVTGWIKALAGGTPGSGGWDGFIKFSGTWANGVHAGAYPSGVNGIGTGLTGFAWGSDVVGWIDFRPKIAGTDTVIDNPATADSLLVCGPNWHKDCPTPPNACGLRNFGNIQCDETCSAKFPPSESSCNTLNAPTGGGGTSACPSLTFNPQTVPTKSGKTKITWNGACATNPINPYCVLYESPNGDIVSTSTSGTNVESSPINGRLTLILECGGTGVGTTSVSKTVFSGFEFKEI
ncbi:MAG: hypothetical protein AAB488_01810 [Patescibacteria group bacterium]